MLDDKEKQAVQYLTSQAFREGEIGYGDVASRLDITPKTLYNWRQKPEFQEALKQNQEKSVDERLLERIMDTGDPQAINLYYKRHGLFKDSQTEREVLQMTKEEIERIEEEIVEAYAERHGLNLAAITS